VIMHLIVGLGNPGKQYYYTRHNIGFRIIDCLSQVHGIPINKEKFNAVYGKGFIREIPVILAKPMAYMNMSGPPTRKLAEYFKIDVTDVLVLHDDIDLLFGKIKIKKKGGNAGHKGIRSLIETFGSGAFSRIRIGIGRPDNREEVTDYVLGRFDPQQEAVVEEVVSKAQEAVETIMLNKKIDDIN
jgi:PTH1 family peptidyl-tRNA hydrolase